MSTLYVSDLDGTLLRSDERTSQYTNQVINGLVEQGMIFSYATARSYNTSHKVTEGLNARIPLIIYNGAFVKDNVTGEIMISNFFDDSVEQILDTLLSHSIYPIVYAMVNGVERFSFYEPLCNREIMDFVHSRQGDPRTNSLDRLEDLYQGDIFYITCIDSKEKLEPLYHQYKDHYHCVFQEDIYTHDQWLEIMPIKASKSNAITQLKEYLGCDRVISFGDGKNDIDMFEISDEAYAVDNAVDELKAVATQIIESNDNDGVAKWLERHWEMRK